MKYWNLKSWLNWNVSLILPSSSFMVWGCGCHSEVWFSHHQLGNGSKGYEELWLSTGFGASLPVPINCHLFCRYSLCWILIMGYNNLTWVLTNFTVSSQKLKWFAVESQVGNWESSVSANNVTLKVERQPKHACMYTVPRYHLLC